MSKKDHICTINAYEDMINIEDAMNIQGQMCVYLEVEVNSPKSQKALKCGLMANGVFIKTK